MGEPVTRYVAWAPHSPEAFAGATERDAISFARDWAMRTYREPRPTWRTMQKRGWRVSEVKSDG